MIGLRALQTGLQAHVLSSDGRIAREIESTPNLDAQARLLIYQDAYRLRLLEALGADFSGLHTLLGDADFEALGRAYVDTHPSRFFSLRDFGEHLPRFLHDHADYREQPILAEMAALEWALVESFDAADTPPLARDALAAMAAADWPALRLGWHPSVRRLDFRSNAPELWLAIARDESPQGMTTAPAARPWLVWRKDLNTRLRALDDDEAWAMDGFAGGARFAEIGEGLCRWRPQAEVPNRIIGLLELWLREQLLVALQS